MTVFALLGGIAIGVVIGYLLARNRFATAAATAQERARAAEDKAALIERGVSANAAILAAQAGVTVFHVAFARWVEQDDPTALRRLIDESLEELRSVTAA